MRAALLALMLMIGSQAGAESVLYCATEKNLATGLIQDGTKWRTGKFEEIRFTLKGFEDFSSIQVEDEKFTCQRPWQYTDPNLIWCSMPLGYTFGYNKSNQKFTYVYCSIASYIHPSHNQECIIYAGSCENF